MTSFKNEFGGPDISHGDIKESYIHGGMKLYVLITLFILIFWIAYFINLYYRAQEETSAQGIQ